MELGKVAVANQREDGYILALGVLDNPDMNYALGMSQV